MGFMGITFLFRCDKQGCKKEFEGTHHQAAAAGWIIEHTALPYPYEEETLTFCCEDHEKNRYAHTEKPAR